MQYCIKFNEYAFYNSNSLSLKIESNININDIDNINRQQY